MSSTEWNIVPPSWTYPALRWTRMPARLIRSGIPRSIYQAGQLTDCLDRYRVRPSSISVVPSLRKAGACGPSMPSR
jgi:hypothetical protein